MNDLGFICARCGGEVQDVTHGRDNEVEGIGYRHDRRVEPWDHELELAVGEPVEYEPACDFCAVPDPRWLYYPSFDAEDDETFEVELDVTGLSPDDTAGAVLNVLYPWYACDTCSVLVADRNLEALVDRALARTPVPPGSSLGEEAVRARLTGAFSVFLSTRPGRPQPSRAL